MLPGQLCLRGRRPEPRHLPLPPYARRWTHAAGDLPAGRWALGTTGEMSSTAGQRRGSTRRRPTGETVGRAARARQQDGATLWESTGGTEMGGL